jgi:hypothetical protein
MNIDDRLEALTRRLKELSRSLEAIQFPEHTETLLDSAKRDGERIQALLRIVETRGR